MKSGGIVEFTGVRNTDGNRQIDAPEIDASVRATQGESISNETDVLFGSDIYSWADLRRAIQDAARQHGQFQAGENLSPDEIRAAIQRLGIIPSRNLDSLLRDMEAQAGQIQNIKRQIQDLETRLAQAPRGEQANLQTLLNEARGRLQTMQQTLQQQLTLARQFGASESRLRPYAELLGESARTDGTGAGGGAGNARFMTVSPGFQPGAGGAGGAPGTPGARAQYGPPGVYGGGYGDPLFGGFAPPTSSAYGAAMYMDSMISEGLGSLGQSQREGWKLMMLFFYYARMAESGDTGAMYQFIKFINYIIAKDKARQNIQISSKLIQLQDLSRKSTEALMQTPTDDPDKINDFTKALHKAKSEETTIATSQKLLADMLQEYAHVTEALTNSSRFLLDTWGRVLRSVTSR